MRLSTFTASTFSLSPKLHRVGDVDAVGGDAVLVQPDRFPIEVDVAGLAHALELEEDLAAGKLGGQLEVLAIPREPLVGASVAAAVRDDLAEGVDVVEAVRRADDRPLRVVEGGSFRPGDILADEPPVQVEVDPGTRRIGRREAGGRS